MANFNVTVTAQSGSSASVSTQVQQVLGLVVQATSGSLAALQMYVTRAPAYKITPPLVEAYLRGSKVRGPQIVAQLQAILQLVASSPVNLAPVVGPVVLLEQAVCKVMKTVAAYMMNDPNYPHLPLAMQDSIAQAAVSWAELYAVTGNVAFYDKFPNVSSLLTTSPSAQLFSAQARAVATAVDVRLESFLNVPILAGLTVQTFWSTTQEAVESLSRLLVIDYVIGSDPTIYYGPNATVQNIVEDARRVFLGIGPLVPDVQAVLTQIRAAVASGYVDTSALTITSLRMPSNASLQQLAAQIYGNPDLFKQLADFNGLVYPYVSDDPIAKLGPPKQLGVRLAADVVQGSSRFAITNVSNFAQDDRLLFQYDGHIQVVTITGIWAVASLPSWDAIGGIDELPDIDTGAGIINIGSFDWNTVPPQYYDREALNFTIQVSPPTDIAYAAANTVVTLYPSTYDGGVVLGTGDTLLVPNVLGQSTALIIDNNYTDAQRLGTDAATDQDGNLNIANGDLATVTGVPNLKQALINRFKVERGMLIHHPTYGTGLRGYLGRVIGPGSAFLVTVDATQTALADPRVTGLAQIQSLLIADAVNIEFNVALANGVLAFPTNLELTVPTGG